MAAERSLVPKKLQIPIMGIAALVFVMLLVRQFGGRGARPATPPPSPGTPTTASVPGQALDNGRIPLTDLQNLVIGIRSARLDQRETPEDPPPLPRNPFRKRPKPVVQAPPPPTDPTDQGPTVSIPRGPSAAERRAMALANLNITATCRIGDEAMALVNGRFVRAGEVINGFTVKTIEQGKVTLEDEIGQEILVLRKEFTP